MFNGYKTLDSIKLCLTHDLRLKSLLKKDLWRYPYCHTSGKEARGIRFEAVNIQPMIEISNMLHKL